MAIAQALGLNYAFLCEFEEEYSPLRDARSQVGRTGGTGGLKQAQERRREGAAKSALALPAGLMCLLRPLYCLQGGGVHGNTILSKFDFLESAVVPHRWLRIVWVVHKG